MRWRESENRKSNRSSFQFSLLALFGLQLAAAILVAVAIRLHNSGYFPALFSLHTLVALLPILTVCVLNAAGLVSGRTSAEMSLVFYVFAFMLPAIGLQNDAIFGVLAFGLSFLGAAILLDWIVGNTLFTWAMIACLMGAAANVLFMVGYVTSLTAAAKRIRLGRSTATLGFCLSLMVVVPLNLHGNLTGIYLGHGLWVASMLALALGGWRMRYPENRSGDSAENTDPLGSGGITCKSAPTGDESSNPSPERALNAFSILSPEHR